MTRPTCRFCGAALEHTFVDLGVLPLCESYVDPARANERELFYPLHAYVCANCFLVQVEELEKATNIYSDYAYFSSYSDSWLQHAQSYVEMATKRFGLDRNHQVIEIASNDGYLLQYFVAKGIPALGVEPAANIAAVATKKGIPTVVEFFGEATAKKLVAKGIQADLLVGNNVLAHVPGLNDFVEGLRVVLKPHGVLTMEFAHLMRLIAENQFDTIYHEHFSYLSLITVEKVFTAHGLALFDVEELPTHGGSLRIYACDTADGSQTRSPRVDEVKAREVAAGLTRVETYATFTEKVTETKRRLLEFLIAAKRAGKSIAGYGAPGKGNTLLNYCGIRADFLDYTVDRSPHKQGLLLPGTRIPIYHPDKIKETKPDYVLILPWNLKNEVMDQMAYIREWGGQFVVPIPELRVYP
ncbi:MAG TPA: class I SAM-dependent methyltransferase [Verrucomicrobiae bacterium]|nr:class I SAM-dependent methyltransferase [Verrucomicrobiae bacterium]